MTLLCVGINKGGAGSFADAGIGRGISRMAYSKSGGERSSIGNIVESVDNKAVRVGAKRFRRSSSRELLKALGSNHFNT